MDSKAKDIEILGGNIFDGLGLPGSDEVMVRAKLLHEVSSLIRASGLTQQEVAKRFGITQPKVSMLLSGHLSAFSTGTLLGYLSVLGCQIQIRVRKPRSRVGIFREKGFISVQ